MARDAPCIGIDMNRASGSGKTLCCVRCLEIRKISVSRQNTAENR